MKKRIRRLSIKQMSIDDLPAVFHLGEDLFTLRKHPNLYRVWDEYGIMYLYTNDPESCLVAYYGKKLVGFLLAAIIDKRNSTRKYGYLEWLGVDPKYKRRGIASKLFDEFKNRMAENEVKMLLVDTQSDNEGAIRFFESKGFASPTDHVYLSLHLDKK